MHMFVYDCCIFNVPPLSPIDLAVVDYTAAGYDYFVDDRTPTVELPGKQSHSLPQILPTFSILSCTSITAAATITILFNCIAYFCRPLMYLPLSYVAFKVYILFS